MVLTVAGVGLKQRLPVVSTSNRRMGILIPAHDEEINMEEVLAALSSLRYPRERFEIIVIADNCSDGTAEIARRNGATVMERKEAISRGKGQALTWAFEMLSQPRYPHDAYVILDADSTSSENLLKVIDQYLSRGWEAIQTRIEVLKPGESWITALRFASFASYSYLRPLGRTILGSTAHLQGTGMCFSAGLLTRYPWRATALAEDLDYGAGLAASGTRVAFAPDATVYTQMPRTMSQARPQLVRWLHGRYQIIRKYTAPLLHIAIRQKSLWRAETALNLLLPPMTFLISVPALFLLLNMGLLALNLEGSFGSTMAWIWGSLLLIFLMHIAAALYMVKAPLYIYLSLFSAPIYALKLLRVHLSILLGREKKEWIRTPRIKKNGS